MSATSKALVIRFFDEFCNGRELAIAGDLFSADHVYHDPVHHWVGIGPEAMKDLLATYHAAFPDAHWRLEVTIVAGDTVVTRWRGSGTHKARLLGIPPTGARVHVPGISIHRIAGGRIAETWNIWDALGMFQQLGIVKLPSLTGAAR